MRKILYFVYLFVFMSIASCVNIPKGVLSMKQMENVLVEMHKAEAVSEEFYSKYGSTDKKQMLMAEVFKKSNITKAQFDTSLVFYSTRLDLYMKIYQKVLDRLNNDKEYLYVDLLDFERSLLTPTGDSVNIWKKSPQIILSTEYLNPNFVFEIRCDSNFRINDHLEWRMKFLNLPADSLSQIYVSFGNFNSTEINAHVYGKPDSVGWFELKIDSCAYKTNEVSFGNITLVNYDSEKKYEHINVDSVSILRFRSDNLMINIPEVSMKTDSIILNNDSLS